jgi:hypothetical protein
MPTNVAMATSLVAVHTRFIGDKNALPTILCVMRPRVARQSIQRPRLGPRGAVYGLSFRRSSIRDILSVPASGIASALRPASATHEQASWPRPHGRGSFFGRARRRRGRPSAAAVPAAWRCSPPIRRASSLVSSLAAEHPPGFRASRFLLRNRNRRAPAVGVHEHEACRVLRRHCKSEAVRDRVLCRQLEGRQPFPRLQLRSARP